MTTREEIVAMREAAEDEAEHVLQCYGEYHPDYHEVADAIFFREAQHQAYERAAEVCESVKDQSRHPLFRSSAEICGFEIRALIEGVEK